MSVVDVAAAVDVDTHTDMADADDGHDTMGIFPLVGEFFLTKPWMAGGYLVLLLVGTLVSIIGVTTATSKLFTAIGRGDRKTGITQFAILSGAIVGMWGINYGIDTFSARLKPDFNAFVNQKFVDRILHHNEQQTLDQAPLAYRNLISTATSSAYTVFDNLMQTYIPNGILLLVLVIYMLTIRVSWGVALAAAAGGVAGLFALGQSAVQNGSQELEESVQELQHRVFDTISAMETVTTRNESDAELAKLEVNIQELADQSFAFNKLGNGFKYGTHAVVTVVLLTIIFLAVRTVQKDDNAVNKTAMLAVSLMINMYNKLQNVSATNNEMLMQSGKFSALRMPELDHEPPAAPTPLELQTQRQQLARCARQCAANHRPFVEFSDVSFKYATRDADTLQHLSWTVHGGIHGLFGRSGIGKSSVGRLLVQEYRQHTGTKDHATSEYSGYTGTIRLFGVDTATLYPQTVRSFVALSQQSMHFPNVSVREVLKYGNGDVDEVHVRRMWAQIRTAFVDVSLDSKVGRAGSSNLSTGQNQLLRIANLMLAPQSIIVLDEPCSGVDVKHRPHILDMIRKLGETKVAVVLITHDREVAQLAKVVHEMS